MKPTELAKSISIGYRFNGLLIDWLTEEVVVVAERFLTDVTVSPENYENLKNKSYGQ